MQRLNHHHLYIFWVFGKTASVTKTAQELAIAQSAVTAQLKQLEENLALQLIDRTHPRMPELTEAGTRILAYADSIFETSRELINWATKGALPRQRTLRIGALSGLSRNLQYEFLAPLLTEMDVRFTVTTGDQEKLVDLLRSHDLDVILSSHNVGAEKGVRFYTHVLTSSPVVFVIKHQKSAAKLDELVRKRGLFVPGAAFEARAELDAYLKERGWVEFVRGEVDDVALLRILSLRSGAVVALPELGVRSEVKNRELQVLERKASITQRFYAITRSRMAQHGEMDSLIKKFKD